MTPSMHTNVCEAFRGKTCDHIWLHIMNNITGTGGTMRKINQIYD